MTSQSVSEREREGAGESIPAAADAATTAEAEVHLNSHLISGEEREERERDVFFFRLMRCLSRYSSSAPLRLRLFPSCLAHRRRPAFLDASASMHPLSRCRFLRPTSSEHADPILLLSRRRQLEIEMPREATPQNKWCSLTSRSCSLCQRLLCLCLCV